MNQYRAIYAKGVRGDSPSISGVAWASNHLAATVPSNSCTRYDDPDFATSYLMDVSVLQMKSNPGITDEDALPWGYLTHEACWQVLEEACYPEQINVAFLFGLLRSFPLSTLHVVYWGHDYGHVYDLAFPSRRATDENDLEDYVMLGLCGYATPAALRLHNSNPSSPSRLHEMIDKAHLSRRDLVTEDLGSGDAQSTSDKFDMLPPELREQILCELPSPDVVSVLRASRAFHSIQLSQTFWSSRFRRGFDFGHIFEVSRRQKRPGKYCDYRSLYHDCRKHCASSDLRSRSRVWNLIEPVAALVARYNLSRLQGEPVLATSHQLKSSDNSNWQWAIGICGESTTWTWARRLERRGITVGGGLRSIDVSLVNFHTLTFVTGLCLAYADGSKDQLGYILSTTECLFDSGTGTEIHLKGFAIGTGFMGVHGIGGLLDDGAISKWVGASQGHCDVQKIYAEDVREIQGLFDVRCLSTFLTTANVARVSNSSTLERGNRYAIPAFRYLRSGTTFESINETTIEEVGKTAFPTRVFHLRNLEPT